MDEVSREKLSVMTYYYCGNCQAIRTAFFAGAQQLDVTGRFVGGDIVCEECNFIIATVYKEIACANQ